MKHMDSKKFAHLDQLKRTDVEKWAGRVIYKRGDAYHCSGRVEKLALTPDGALIGGQRPYYFLDAPIEYR